jgi:rRNA biogenesis protein RRP5
MRTRARGCWTCRREAQEPESSDDEEEEEGDEPMEVDSEPVFAPIEPVASTSKSPAVTLEVKGGFKWTEESDEDEISAGSHLQDPREMSGAGRRRRRRKQIELDLTGDMHTRTPESNADFERQLLGSPNSSYLWIQYMSFQIQLSEIEKAREVAQRAFEAISFREEQERLNVWFALLNLENIYGTEQTIEGAFKDAARRNDAKTVYLGLATIFEQSEKFDVRCFYSPDIFRIAPLLTLPTES